MSKKKPTAHVVCNKSLRCLNCGEEQELPKTMTINFFVAAGGAFEKDHRRCKPSERGKKRFEFNTPEEWINSWDTGISSQSLWSVFTDRLVDRHGIPIDPSDFGRCHRLLAKFPEWRQKLESQADRLESLTPGWKKLIARWGELEKLYDEEFPTGSAPKLFALMQETINGPNPETVHAPATPESRALGMPRGPR